MMDRQVARGTLFYALRSGDRVPGHSTFPKTRHGRFRRCNLHRRLFEEVAARCMAAGLVAGAEVAVDGAPCRRTPVPRGGSPARPRPTSCGRGMRLPGRCASTWQPSTSEPCPLASPRRSTRPRCWWRVKQGLVPAPLLARLLGQGVTPHVPLINRPRQRPGFLTRDALLRPGRQRYRCLSGNSVTARALQRPRSFLAPSGRPRAAKGLPASQTPAQAAEALAGIWASDAAALRAVSRAWAAAAERR